VPDGRLLKPLSEREQQLIELASNGFTDVAIAYRLGISAGTVATYWARVRTKFGPYPRTELIALAVKGQYEEEVGRLKEQNDALVQSLRRWEGSEAQDVSNDFFREALESAGDAIFVVDGSGTIVWTNKAADGLFGYDQAELAGKHMALLIPGRYRKVHEQHVKDFFASPVTHTMAQPSTASALLKNGEEVAIALTLAGVETGGQPLAVCTVRPLSSIASQQLTGRHAQE
jgi:PAS domain S-box-containing protein